MTTKGDIRIFSEVLKTAAKYSYPYANVKFDNSTLLNNDYSQVLDILFRNQVLLTCHRNLSKTSQYGSLLELQRSIEEKINKERILIIDVKQKLEEMDRLFEVYGIRYLLPKFTFFYREHHDIDVLVSLEDFNLTLGSLKSNGYVITSIQSPWKVTTAKWMGGRRSSIHVHSRLHWYPWDPLELVPSSKLWERTIPFDFNSLKLSVPCPEDGILVLAAHAIFENHQISLSDVFQLEGILREFHEIKWREIIDIAFEHGWCADLCTFLKVVNCLSISLYGKILVPESIFSYAEKRISSLERVVRKLAGNIDLSSIPCVYPFPQVGISFMHVVFKRYGLNTVAKLIDGFVYFAIYQLKSPHGDPCAQI